MGELGVVWGIGCGMSALVSFYTSEVNTHSYMPFFLFSIIFFLCHLWNYMQALLESVQTDEVSQLQRIHTM